MNQVVVLHHRRIYLAGKTDVGCLGESMAAGTASDGGMNPAASLAP